ncbi:hypothetical protein GCM10010251_19960 [Streptomyces aurantiogriseus]|uniref:Uncharacterized protein n=1 Tax=Streptomyces aurantiogriseus TaxID=66870 RepID=A0A918C480_9ACTN|nr:hypothetical protein GCM10010251_19960 [Streptomyces aurantiogriseus]
MGCKPVLQVTVPERSPVGNSPAAALYAHRVVDTTPLSRAVEHFADRLRAAPQSRLQRGAAAEALALARELARWAQVLEDAEREPRVMPDAGMFAAADQITVAGHDLAVVLTSEGEVAQAVLLVEEAQKRAGV